MNQNRKAFLDTIAFAEGTDPSPASKNKGYDVIVIGIDGVHEVFTDYSTHPFANGRPSKVINSKGLTSNASGRYQFMLRDWKHYRETLGLANPTDYPDGAFGPAAQDAWAIQLIRERGALPLIDLGQIELAIQRVSNLWASLPGANYADQPMRPMGRLIAQFKASGGVVEVLPSWKNQRSG